MQEKDLDHTTFARYSFGRRVSCTMKTAGQLAQKEQERLHACNMGSAMFKVQHTRVKLLKIQKQRTTLIEKKRISERYRRTEAYLSRAAEFWQLYFAKNLLLKLVENSYNDLKKRENLPNSALLFAERVAASLADIHCMAQGDKGLAFCTIEEEE